MIQTKLSKNEQGEYKYLISVLGAAVRDAVPPSPPEKLNLNKVLAHANITGLSSMFAVTMLKLPKDCFSDQLREELTEIANTGIFIDVSLDYEVEKLLKNFDKHKIKNAPVKGYFMKKEYPRSDFRSVSDFDILFDRSQVEKLKLCFAELGYTFCRNDDSQYHFIKNPQMYIEMHASLVHEDEFYFQYLCDQLDRTVKRNGYDCSYELTPEDHYIYMLVHASNHLRIAGLSIRMVLDVYVYNRNHKNDLNTESLKKRLEEMKLTRFESRLREIAFNWFDNPEPKISFDDFETLILLSARLGRLSTAIMMDSMKGIEKAEEQGKKGKSKLSYFISSIFKSKKQLQFSYPYLQKYPFLLPLSWVQFWGYRIFVRKNVNFKQGIENRFSYTDEEYRYYKGILDEFGFDHYRK